MLTPTRIISNVIVGQTVGCNLFKRIGPNEEVLISTVHFDRPIAEAVTYQVTRAGAVTPIGQSEVLGKDNEVDAIIFDDGTLWVAVAEAIAAGSGTTSKIDIYEYSGAFPALPPSSSSVDQIARNTANTALMIANQALSLAQAVKAKVNEILSIINIP